MARQPTKKVDIQRHKRFHGHLFLGLWARREAAHQHDAVLPRQPHNGAAGGVVADNGTIPNQMQGTQVRWINKTEVTAVRCDPPRSEDDRGFGPRDVDWRALPIAVGFIATRRTDLAVRNHVEILGSDLAGICPTSRAAAGPQTRVRATKATNFIGRSLTRFGWRSGPRLLGSSLLQAWLL